MKWIKICSGSLTMSGERFSDLAAITMYYFGRFEVKVDEICQEAFVKAHTRKLSSWSVWLNSRAKKERNNYISLFPVLLVLNIASHIWKMYTSQIKMKKIYILKHYPSPPPPSFPRPWDICLELSYLQPLIEKNPGSAPVEVKARLRHAYRVIDHGYAHILLLQQRRTHLALFW